MKSAPVCLKIFFARPPARPFCRAMLTADRPRNCCGDLRIVSAWRRVLTSDVKAATSSIPFIPTLTTDCSLSGQSRLRNGGLSNGYQRVSRDTSAAKCGVVPDHWIDGYNSQAAPVTPPAAASSNQDARAPTELQQATCAHLRKVRPVRGLRLNAGLSFGSKLSSSLMRSCGEPVCSVRRGFE